MRPVIVTVLAVMAALCQTALADSRTVPESREQIMLSYAPLVRETAPGVVNIYTRRVVRQRAVSPLFDDPFFRRFFGDNLPFGRPQERTQNALGSGVIVAPDGLIVTNHHVIAEADEVTVVLTDRRELDAQIILSDESTDLALLRVAVGDEQLPHLTLATGATSLRPANGSTAGAIIRPAVVRVMSRAARSTPPAIKR